MNATQDERWCSPDVSLRGAIRDHVGLQTQRDAFDSHAPRRIMSAGDIVKRFGVTGTVLRAYETVALVQVHTAPDLMSHEASWPSDECEFAVMSRAGQLVSTKRD